MPSRMWFASTALPRTDILPRCVFGAIDEAHSQKLPEFELALPTDELKRWMSIRRFQGAASIAIDLCQPEFDVIQDILKFLRATSL